MRAVAYSKAAVKVLRRLPVAEAERIRRKVQQFADDPASQANNVTALVGRPYIRLRVGDWRVIIDDRGNVIEVVKVGPRGGVYD
jgi:mRNA interferase RelE/StbE